MYQQNQIGCLIWKGLNNGKAGGFFTSNDDYASMKGSQYRLRLANMDITLR